MQAGYQIQGGGRVDVETRKDLRRVALDVQGPAQVESLTVFLTLSEARAIASALMGAAAEA